MSLLPHDRHQLEVESSIDPTVIARRGYRRVTAQEAATLGFSPAQCGAGLFMPTHTLAGVQSLGMLKRDKPRLDDDDKPQKYEWPTGHGHLLDAHPDALAALKTRGVEKWFTEGHKKADAAWSRGLACVNLPGVYAFLRRRFVVPDLDELELDGETCYVVFDSDVTRKRSVEDALLRFCEALRRRGAKVIVVYLPQGPDGSKIGLDDFFAAGGTVDELRALAKPWDGQGPGVWLRSPGDADPAQLQASLSGLIQAIQNPDHSRADLQLMASVAGLVMHKRATDDIEPDGTIVLSPAEIADDYRPAPPPGERVSPVNPTTGTKPRMARDRVGGLMGKAIEKGLLRAKPRPTKRQHKDGSWYKTTDWVIDPVASFAEMIDPWAHYRPTEPKLRKPRTILKTCPECGEAHPVKRVDYCMGCGAQMGEPRIIAPEPPEQSADVASDNLSEAENEAIELSPSPPLVRNVRSFIGGAQPSASDEPAWLADAPELAPDEVSEAPWDEDFGLTAPRLFDAQEMIDAASHALSPDDGRRVLQELNDQLSRIARSRGRAPVPKPGARSPGAPAGTAGDDVWTNA
jgi:hypothetical protein